MQPLARSSADACWLRWAGHDAAPLGVAMNPNRNPCIDPGSTDQLLGARADQGGALTDPRGAVVAVRSQAALQAALCLPRSLEGCTLVDTKQTLWFPLFETACVHKSFCTCVGCFAVKCTHPAGPLCESWCVGQLRRRPRPRGRQPTASCRWRVAVMRPELHTQRSAQQGCIGVSMQGCRSAVQPHASCCFMLRSC
jgi:hypothetical protein